MDRRIATHSASMDKDEPEEKVGLVIDEWGGVIANINPRRCPSHPSGTYAFVTPCSRAKGPDDGARVLLRSSKATAAARVEIRQDRDGSVRLQRQFELTSALDPSIMPAVPLPMFGNRELIGVELFQNAEEILATALDTAPGAAGQRVHGHAIPQHADVCRKRELR